MRSRSGQRGVLRLRLAVVPLVAPVLVAILLTGCSSSNGPDQGDDALVAESAEGSVPTFSGPWAAEFDRAYREATSDFTRRVLEKEDITASDLAEAQERNRQCLDAAGFTDIEHYPIGGMKLTPPQGIGDDKVQELVEECANQSGLGQIELLHSALLFNPNHEDMSQLAVQCLIEQKVVEPSFTVADLESWYDNQDLRLRRGGSADNCTYDPLRRTGTW